ncbi:hypothetical protein U9M48_040396 [Paspalum notatum var. saurae]|uniref:Uncharacterized protein n=1 Tax=Paspalum notatum var. saurae TaxID=547442 RepID=A0AAQ3ULQ0_PASNO
MRPRAAARPAPRRGAMPAADDGDRGDRRPVALARPRKPVGGGAGRGDRESLTGRIALSARCAPAQLAPRHSLRPPPLSLSPPAFPAAARPPCLLALASPAPHWAVGHCSADGKFWSASPEKVLQIVLGNRNSVLDRLHSAKPLLPFL